MCHEAQAVHDAVMQSSMQIIPQFQLMTYSLMDCGKAAISRRYLEC